MLTVGALIKKLQEFPLTDKVGAYNGGSGDGGLGIYSDVTYDVGDGEVVERLGNVGWIFVGTQQGDESHIPAEH